MNRIARRVAAAACALTAVSTGIEAQTVESPMLQVKGGEFTLRQGQSADLAGRGILLSVGRVFSRPDGTVQVYFTINGLGGSSSIGVRRDLKGQLGTGDLLKDVGTCVVDLVGGSAIKGAPPSATFRLLCQ